jgi:hypothetical protein
MLEALPQHFQREFPYFLSARAGLTPLFAKTVEVSVSGGMGMSEVMSNGNAIRHASYFNDEEAYLAQQAYIRRPGTIAAAQLPKVSTCRCMAPENAHT